MDTRMLQKSIFFGYEAVKKREDLTNEINAISRSLTYDIQSRRKNLFIIPVFLVSLVLNTIIMIILASSILVGISFKGESMFSFVTRTYNIFETPFNGIITWLFTFMLFRVIWFFVADNIETSSWQEYYAKYKNKSSIVKKKTEYDHLNNLYQELITSKQYNSDINNIPEKYRTTGWLTLIFNAVKNGRAFSLKEAINIAEQDWRLNQIAWQNHQIQLSINEAIYQAELASLYAKDAASTARINFYSRF